MLEPKDIENLQSSIQSLEKRIIRIEKLLSIKDETEENESVSSKNYDSESMELHFGKVWLAKVGIIILLIGFLFLITSPFEGLPQIIPVLISYAISFVFLLLIKFGKNRLKDLEGFLLISFYTLVFFSTLRLYFFTAKPFIINAFLEMCLLTCVSLILIYFSYKRKSQSLISVSYIFGFISALVLNLPYFSLILIVLFSMLMAFSANKLKSTQLVFSGLALTYIAHSVWLIKYLVTTDSLISIYVILFYFALYSYIVAKFPTEKEKDFFSIAATFINSVFSTFLLVFSAFTIIPGHLHICCLIGFLVFITTAVIYWKKGQTGYSTYFIAIAAYLLLSVAIVSYFPKPDYFVWLSWQSLIVVSTALLFKSRFIIIANFFIYLGTLLAYLFLAGKVSSISISLGLVALLSARILNWQKDRLSLNSEIIRNSYLFCAFFIFPYSLYNWLPQKYVIFSWVILAIVYFLLSVLLKNIKYRLMALLTLLLTVVYLLLFGITGLSDELRIITFIILGIILLVVSIFYTKLKGKSIKNS